jgi:hypothetical protein
VTDAGRLRWWRAAALFASIVWLGVVLALNGPGHLSVDSLIQLADGKSGVMTSFNPIFITVVFAKLAALGSTRLLVILSTVMLFAALLALLPGVPRPRFAGVALLAAAFAGPALLIYPAIVWKDVWFAHFALLGFGVIALRHWLPRTVVDGGSLLLFAAAMLTRQNGAIVAACGAATLAWAHASDLAARTGAPPRVGRLLAAGGARLALLLVLALALSWAARLAVHEVRAGEVATGVRVLLAYDVAGMIAREDHPDLSRLAAFGVDVDALVRMNQSDYSAERVDTLDKSALNPVGNVPLHALAGQWLALAAAHPIAYLGHRAEVFAWLLGLRDPSRCLPVHVGYGDAALVEKAGVSSPPAKRSYRLYVYSQRFVDTAYFMPAAWALGSAVVLAFALRRRERDPVVIGLQVAALAYLAAYFFVSIACDFRYAYFCVLAATVGGVWLVAGGSRRGERNGPAIP